MEYLERLSKAIESLEDSSDKLSVVPELLIATKDLTEEIIKEKEVILASQKEIDRLKEEIISETEALSKLTEDNKKSFEQITIVIKDELLRNKKENIEVVETVTTAITNKLMVTESNIQATVNSKLVATEETIQASLSKHTNNVIECINNLSNKMDYYHETLIELRNLTNQVKIMVIIALVIGMISIVTGILI